jgi:hypothetical protein
MNKRELILDLIHDLYDYLRLDTFIDGNINAEATDPYGVDKAKDLKLHRYERMQIALRNNAKVQRDELDAKLSVLLNHYAKITNPAYEQREAV